MNVNSRGHNLDTRFELYFLKIKHPPGLNNPVGVISSSTTHPKMLMGLRNRRGRSRRPRASGDIDGQFNQLAIPQADNFSSVWRLTSSVMYAATVPTAATKTPRSSVNPMTGITSGITSIGEMK